MTITNIASIRPSVVRFASPVVGRKSRHQIDMVRAGATWFSDTALFYLDAHDLNAGAGKSVSDSRVGLVG